MCYIDLFSQGPVNFKVAVPNIQDKAEWKLNGQLLAFTLPLTDSVSTGDYLIFTGVMPKTIIKIIHCLPAWGDFRHPLALK